MYLGPGVKTRFITDCRLVGAKTCMDAVVVVVEHAHTTTGPLTVIVSQYC